MLSLASASTAYGEAAHEHNARRKRFVLLPGAPGGYEVNGLAVSAVIVIVK